MPDYDVICVGGGLAGSAFAKAMAEAGFKVLVLERETSFKDRVRGEMVAPWGASEARQLGLLDLLRGSCAHEVNVVEMGMGPRNLSETTPQRLPALTFAHHEMQEALISATQKAGAEVRRGVTVERILPGQAPKVTIYGSSQQISGRLVVGADGRSSPSRKSAAFSVENAPVENFLAGVMLTGMPVPEDQVYFIFNPQFGTIVGFIPIGKGRFRAYFGYPKKAGYRLQGEQMLGQFVSRSAETFPHAANLYANANAMGPLASFDVSESWVTHPCVDGVVLIGDAAGTSDPSFGQGLNLTLRDARVLRDALLASPDWNAAAHHYAEEHAKYFRSCSKVEGWLRTLFQDSSPAASACRERAMPLIAQDQTRVPDHLFSGPDLPADENVRSRLFGEC